MVSYVNQYYVLHYTDKNATMREQSIRYLTLLILCSLTHCNVQIQQRPPKEVAFSRQQTDVKCVKS